MTEKRFKELIDSGSSSGFILIENKRSQRADLHAFLLLDELLPGNQDIVACAEHDEIFLEVDVDKLREVAKEEQVLELSRCGVNYDESTDSLSMFV